MGFDEKYPLALPKDTILAGQYVIQSVLGQGGFGITYRALDHKSGKAVAVKEFFPDTMATRTQTTVTAFSGERGENFTYGKQCFLQEAETLAEFIGNENIVRVHSYFEENGTAYFVMDYIEGTSFDEYIKQHGGRVSYEEAEKFLLPVMNALAAVHSRGIVHRDVTPDNIYITNDGTVKLLDFGAARYSIGDKSRSLDVVLKHGFAPKEQYTRHGKQGPYTDVYAVGASFYFAITGRRPPDSIDRIEEDELVPPSRLGVNIPKGKEDAILFALNVQPNARFQSMAAFAQALAAGQGQPAPAQQMPMQGQPVPAQQMPMRGQPAPAQQAPMQGQQTPAQQAPMQGQQTPVQQMPMQGQPAPAQQAPMQGQPVPARPMPMRGQPAPAQQAPMQGQPVPAQQVPMQGQPVPVQQMPMQGQPVPAQQAPMQGQPAPAQSQPAADGKKNKWILPVGIGACGIGVVAIIVAVVLLVGGGDDPAPKKNNSVVYEQESEPTRPKPTQTVDEPQPTQTVDEPQPTQTVDEPQPTQTVDDPQPTQTVQKGREIRGNDPNNIGSFGLMAIGQNDLYINYPGCGLVQASDSGVNKLDSSGNVHSISLVDDRVYYIDHNYMACSIKTDGTGITYVTELYDYGNMYKLWVCDEGFFFLDYGFKLHFLDKSSKTLETLQNNVGETIAFVGDYVYYISSSYSDTTICRVPKGNLEASEEYVYTLSAASGGVGFMAGAENCLYAMYYTDIGTQFIGIDLGTNLVYDYSFNYALLNDGNGYISSLNVASGYVYFSYADSLTPIGEIYRVGKSEFFSGTITPSLLYSADDCVYVGDLSLFQDQDYMIFSRYNQNGEYEVVAATISGTSDPTIFSEADNY